MNTLRDVLTNLKNESNVGITIVKGYDERLFISYQHLYSQASLYLKRLNAKGVHRGQEFIIIFDSLENFIYLFWACILGGIIPIPVSLESGNIDKIVNILSYCVNPCIYCGNERIAQAMSENINNERVLSNHSFETLECCGEDDAYDYQSEENDLVLIQFSSGSTSAPKGVKLKNHNILSNIHSILKIRNITSSDKFLSWMPLTHDMGLILFHFVPMFLGVDQILIPTPTFIMHPLLWMQVASDEKATVTSGTNFCINYFLNHLKSDENLNWNLEHLNHLIIGAEMISVDLCNKFMSVMEFYGLKKDILSPGYGLAEATVCISMTPSNSLYQWAVLDRSHLSIGEKVKFTDKEDFSCTQIMCVGNIIDNVLVRIIDMENNILEDDFVGLVSASGPNISSGYYNNTESTNEPIGQSYWLNTGDIGFMHNNKLYITGRYKDIIFYNGKCYFSNDLEALIVHNGLAKWNEVAVVGLRTSDSEINDNLVCFLRSKKGNLKKFYEKSMEIKKLLSAYAGVTIDQVAPVSQIPKTTSGKVKRFDLKNRYLQHEWKQIILELEEIAEQYKQELNPEKDAQSKDIESVIADCFANVLGAEVDPDEDLKDYSLDSIAITKIFEQINEKFPKFNSVADLYEYATVRLLAEYIRQLQ